MAHISDIKLIRTDTTLDLSQKAEKASALLEHETRPPRTQIAAPSLPATADSMPAVTALL
ncbi:hypothetical protein DAI22_02g073200 [Oryza sativa Japonica Group]|uniref:Uncharacterized protein n=1 Tax=Oryza sativa subsp. japonica TaxID=39947 RepID=Q7F8R4_ORYSJ|nr:hypothetical protein DAI22_02g073200 [Oryza sativa Japonica Group]BAD15402.1 hypothetical protein [Oryza sativa Japonica Group]